MNRLIWIGLAALVSACGSGNKVDMENASASDVAKEMAKKNGDTGFVSPGKWQQNASLVSMEAPGMPPQVAEAMKKAIGTTQTHETCLTAEQAKHPKEDFFTGADKSCRYEHFNWGDGKIDMKLVCARPDATQTMQMTGTYEPNSYQMAMSVASKGSSPMETMNMKMTVDAKRVGDCEGSKG
ncbi:hypothetical protein GCM10023264_20320 [Sphingomonas daechungensis]